MARAQSPVRTTWRTVTRATAAESTLTTNLNSEITRAKAAETAETARATTAESTLTAFALTVELGDWNRVLPQLHAHYRQLMRASA